jgi:hypothetical protein
MIVNSGIVLETGIISEAFPTLNAMKRRYVPTVAKSELRIVNHNSLVLVKSVFPSLENFLKSTIEFEMTRITVVNVYIKKFRTGAVAIFVAGFDITPHAARDAPKININPSSLDILGISNFPFVKITQAPITSKIVPNMSFMNRGSFSKDIDKIKANKIVIPHPRGTTFETSPDFITKKYEKAATVYIMLIKRIYVQNDAPLTMISLPNTNNKMPAIIEFAINL